jgi:hypothetical protein
MINESKTKKPTALIVDDDTPEDTPEDKSTQTPQQYITLVLKGEVELVGIEAKIANNLRAQKTQQFTLKAEVQKLSEDLRRAQDLLTQLGGRIDENTRLLLGTESERRGVKTKG